MSGITAATVWLLLAGLAGAAFSPGKYSGQFDLTTTADSISYDIGWKERCPVGATLDSALLFWHKGETRPWKTASELKDMSEDAKKAELRIQLGKLWPSPPTDTKKLVDWASVVVFCNNEDSLRNKLNAAKSIGGEPGMKELLNALVEYVKTETNKYHKTDENLNHFLSQLSYTQLVSMACGDFRDLDVSLLSPPVDSAVKKLTVGELPSGHDWPKDSMISVTRITATLVNNQNILVAMLFPKIVYVLKVVFGNDGTPERLDYVDHRRWDNLAEDSTNLRKVYDRDDGYIAKTQENQLEKTDASAVSVFPLFRTFDDGDVSDKAIDYDENDPIKYGAKPILGGVWTSHILIFHEKKTVGKRARRKTDLTLLTVDGEGKLHQRAESWYNGDGATFKADRPPKTVVAAASFARSRLSYLAYGSTESIEAYKLEESSFAVYDDLEEALTRRTTSTRVGDEIEIDKAEELRGLGIVEFFNRVYLVVLQAVKDGKSWVKVFPWNKDSSNDYALSNAGKSVEYAKTYNGIKFFKIKSAKYALLVADNSCQLLRIEYTGEVTNLQEFDNVKDVIAVESNPRTYNVMLVFAVGTLADYRQKVYTFDEELGKFKVDATKSTAVSLSTASAGKLYTAVKFEYKENSYSLLNLGEKPDGSMKKKALDLLQVKATNYPTVRNSLIVTNDLESRAAIVSQNINGLNGISPRHKALDAKVKSSLSNYNDKNVFTGTISIDKIKAERIVKLPGLENSVDVKVKTKVDSTETEVDYRSKMNVKLSEAKSELETIEGNVQTLTNSYSGDLLLLNNGSPQTVTVNLQAGGIDATDVSKTSNGALNVKKLASISKEVPFAELTTTYFNKKAPQNIGGIKTFAGANSFDNLHVEGTLKKGTNSYSVPNLMTYAGDQDVTGTLTFKDTVNVGDVELVNGAKLQKTKENVIKTVDVPSDLYFDNTIPKHLSFGGDVDASKIVPVPSVENGYVEVNNQKITQAKYDNTVLKDAEETVITGELTIEHPSFANDQSTLVSVNVDSLEMTEMHGQNLKELYDVAAWKDCPDGKKDCKVRMAKKITVQKNAKMGNALTITNLNSNPFAKYVQVVKRQCTGPIVLSGDKTFNKVLNFETVKAGTTIDGVGLQELVTKSTAQDINLGEDTLSNFKKGITADNIEGTVAPKGDGTYRNGRPEIDGMNLDELVDLDIDAVSAAEPHVQENTLTANVKFKKLVIDQDAVIKVHGKFNGMDLESKIADVVMTTDATANIPATKTFKKAVKSDVVTINSEGKIKSYSSGNEAKTVDYTSDQFVNKMRPQEITGKKLFEETVEFGVIHSNGAGSTLNGPRTTLVLNDWIDVGATQDTVNFPEALKFEDLRTGSFKTIKKSKESPNPKLNELDASADLALLSGNNNFCTAQENCNQIFKLNVVANKCQVKENLHLPNNKGKDEAVDKFLGVHIEKLGSERVSLTKQQVLEGTYNFKDIELKEGGSYTGTIKFDYRGKDVEIADFNGRFLRNKGSDQEVTSPKTVASLKSPLIATHYDDDGTEKKGVTVKNELFDIKALYDNAVQLNEDYDHSRQFGSLTFENNLKVDKSITVQGNADGVKVVDLATDVITNQKDIDIDGNDLIYGTLSESGEKSTVTIEGTKTFTVAPTVTTNVEVFKDSGDTLLPSVKSEDLKVNNNAFSTLVSGKPQTRYLTRSDEQTITATHKIKGRAQAAKDLYANKVKTVGTKEIMDLYSYDDQNSVHQLTGPFSFTAAPDPITVETLNLKSTLQSRNFNEFVDDTIQLNSGSEVAFTAPKVLFEDNVEIVKPVVPDDLATTNTVDLSIDHSRCADIRKDDSFANLNTFKDLVKIQVNTADCSSTTCPANKKLSNGEYDLHVESSVTLTDPVVDTVPSIEFMKTAAVEVDKDVAVTVVGKVVFNEDLTTDDSVTVSEVGELGVETYGLSFPNDLVQLTDPEITLTANGKDREFEGIVIKANSEVKGLINQHDFAELLNILYKQGSQTVSDSKTFTGKVTAAENIEVGTLNGVQIPSNLIFLDQENTIKGTYKFQTGLVSVTEDLECGLNSDSKIDGVHFKTMSANLFTRDTPQKVETVWTFLKGPVFKKNIVGGPGHINDQDTDDLKSIKDVYGRMYATKLMAQAETTTFCKRVQEMGAAYLATRQVDYYDFTGPVFPIPNSGQITAVEMMFAGNSKVVMLAGVVEADKCVSVHMMTYTIDASGKPSQIEANPTVLKITSDGGSCIGSKVTSISTTASLARADPQATIQDYLITATLDSGTALLKLSVSGASLTLKKAGNFKDDYLATAFDKNTGLMTFVKYTKHGDSKGKTELSIAKVEDLLKSSSVTPAKVWETPDAEAWEYSQLVKGNSHRLQFDNPRNAEGRCIDTEGVVAFTDYAKGFNTPIMRFVHFKMVATTDSPSDFTTQLVKTFKSARASSDFVLTHHKTDLLLVTADTNQVTVERVDPETEKIVETEVIAGGQMLMSNVGKPRDFLGETNVISVMEKSGNLVALSFYMNMGTMGFQLLRRIYSKMDTSSYSILHYYSDKGVFSHIALTGGDKLQRLNGYLVDYTKIPKQFECLDPSVEYPMPAENAYCDASPLHTNCLFRKPDYYCTLLAPAINGLSSEMKDWLLDAHNTLRSKIALGLLSELDKASDMNKLTWDEELATTAQNWAGQCQNKYDNVRGKLVNGNLEPVGQNVHVFKADVEFRNDKKMFKNAVKNWFNEMVKFTKDKNQPFEVNPEYGHFTQVAWAATTKIGCGWVYYKDDDAKAHKYVSLIVCNYYVQGNTASGKMYTVGNPCDDCRSKKCKADEGLCYE